MKKIKNYLAVVLMLAMLFSVAAVGSVQAFAEGEFYQIGDKMEDVTFTDINGETYTLSEVLETKDAVLINLWATWCSACDMEFPFMQEAYEQYQDKLEIFALSIDENDTDEMVKAFAEERGLSFPIGVGGEDIYEKIDTNSIPVSLLIDRFGNIAYMEIGALPTTSSFICLFDAVCGDRYTESVTFTEIPPLVPRVDAIDPAELGKVLNAEGGQLSFENIEDGLCWPMQIVEKDGKTVVSSSNAGYDLSESALKLKVNAKAGDVLNTSFKISSAALDHFSISVNGEVVKSFAGERDWMSYAHEFEADGEYDVVAAYTKSELGTAGEDTLWIEKIELLSGDEAEAALENNPKYIFADETSFKLLNENVQEVIMYVPGIPQLGYYTGWVVNEPEARFLLTLSDDQEPETAVFYESLENALPVVDYMTEKGYEITIPSTPAEDAEMPFGAIDAYDSELNSLGRYFIFEDEAAIQSFLDYLYVIDDVCYGAWVPADEFVPEEIPESAEEEPELVGDSDYTVYCIDENGAPVAGAMVQVCDEATCSVFVSDAEGVCSFTMPGNEYMVHILMAPAGYTDGGDVMVTDPTGGELIFELGNV